MQNDIFKLEKGKVLVIGDIMLDTYYEGDAYRISPEAPVPVVKIEKKRNMLGGAGNVARNITALGSSCTIISVVGSDYHAKIIDNLIHEANVEPILLEDNERPTTVKSRIFARNQQMIRYDEEVAKAICTEVKERLLQSLADHIADYGVILLSDYGKGFLYKELIADIYALAEKKHCQKPKIFIDPKPQNKAFYKNAFLLTPNHKESEELAGLFMHSKEEIKAAAQKILTDLQAENVLITLGAEGMAYFRKDLPAAYHIKSAAKQVFDVTGAGDTVIATMAVCESIGLPYEKACNLATLAAGIVVEKVGSATVTQEELIQSLRTTKIETEQWQLHL